MADAPSGGGGSSWGTLEIILGLLLAISLLSNIGNKGKIYKPLEVTDNTNTNSEVVNNTAASWCGLSITSPLSSQKISGTVRLSGFVGSCNWKPNGNTALSAQVIDSKGKPLSDFINVQTNNADIINTSFDTLIDLYGNPSGSGYLVLVSATQQSDQTTTSVRIPLKFVRI